MSVSDNAKLYAGTSGYSYPSWKPGFYPAKMPSTKFLEHYASRLNLVEINFTFRQIGKAATFDKWVAAVPEGFLFSPKAHNKITHILRLQDAEEFTRVFLDSLAPFRDAGRLGPILFQLPPSLKKDVARLEGFLRRLPRTDRYAFEFRHESWFDDDIYDLLGDYQTALCLAESESLTTPEVLTTEFAYFRLRKPDYADAELNALSEKFKRYLNEGRTIYALFKHEETPAGALCAERVLQMVTPAA